MKLVNKTKAYLKHVTIPVFIAQGQKDALVPAKTAYYLHDEISSEDKEVVFFERSNHLICLGNDQDVLNVMIRSEEHTSELQSRGHLVCRLLLEKKNHKDIISTFMIAT